MKTIEEKAKAYDEIIERAKTMLAAGEVMYGKENNASQLITDIIPELRESEDERIRKWIIEELEITRDAMSGKHDYSNDPDIVARLKRLDEALSWLERQKEQKKEELVYRLNGLMQDYIKEGKDAEEKEHRFKCYQLFWEALEDTNFFEQKEQKPAWSEEDTLMLTAIIQTLERFGGRGTTGMQIDWLKSLRPSQKLSEDQIYTLERICSNLHLRASDDAHKLDEIIEQLKQK